MSDTARLPVSCSSSTTYVTHAWDMSHPAVCQEQPGDETPDADFDTAAYPWTLEPAQQFSGVLDPRTPAAIPCWTSRTVMLKTIEAALETPEGIKARRSEGAGVNGTGGGISLATVMAVAEEDARTADGSNGRNIMTSHETVARRLNHRGIKISWGSVRKARRLLRRLGFQAVVEEGRYLTKTERLELSIELAGRNALRAQQGRKPFVPMRKASKRVFTMCAETVKKTGHLPRRGKEFSPLQGEIITKKRSRAALKSNIQPKTKKRKSPKAGNAEPRPIEIQRIAAWLKSNVGWLALVGHINLICDLLIRCGVDPAVWTGPRLMLALNDRSTRRGWTMPKKITNPLGYLQHLLMDLKPAEAAAEYFRPSRIAEASLAAEQARLAMEERSSAEHRQGQSAGWQKVRSLLARQAEHEQPAAVAA